MRNLFDTKVRRGRGSIGEPRKLQTLGVIRLEKFFDSLGLDGNTIEEKSKRFVYLTKEKGNGWAFNAILKFMQFQLDRANRKEITGSTVRNYLKSIKLFCEMADFTIACKKGTSRL